MPLTNGERVSAILAVTDALKDQSWAVVDLILSQFGFATTDQWQGTTDAYLIEMMKGGSDEQIRGIAEHVGFNFGGKPEGHPAPEPGVWRPEYFRLFISHLSGHRAYAASLQTALLQQGISAFVAHNDIQPTKAWESVIEGALATCDGLLALLHPGFHESLWVDQEIGYVMGRQRHVSSVMFGAAPYGFIGKFQGFVGEDKTPNVLATEVARSLRQNKATSINMSSATVALFEQSGSFISAKTRASYLEQLVYWNGDLRQRVKHASEQNYEIINSWGAQEKIPAILEKWATEPQD